MKIYNMNTLRKLLRYAKNCYRNCLTISDYKFPGILLNTFVYFISTSGITTLNSHFIIRSNKKSSAHVKQTTI